MIDRSTMDPNNLAPAFDFFGGAGPLLVSMPHAGTDLPPDFAARLTPMAARLPDTDWHLPRLYDFLKGAGIPHLVARWSRYLVDLNRPPDDGRLYAGPTTGLHPEILFSGDPVFRAGETPGPDRRLLYRRSIWQPYHAKLAAELEAIRARYGFAILLDAHSIRGEVPLLFQGRLPDLNIGTHEGRSADPDLIRALAAGLLSMPYDYVIDGRFKGGYITRHYGSPATGIHVVQLELAQRAYMEEDPPFAFRSDRADRLRPHLAAFVDILRHWRPA